MTTTPTNTTPSTGTTGITGTAGAVDTVDLDGVHLPGTVAYDQAVSPWNVAVPRRPLAVVVAQDADDVVRAVRWADQRGIRVAVQATGHGAHGTLDDVLLVNTAQLGELHVDPVTRVARIGAGVRWQQVLDAAAPHGLTGLAGSAPHVGVVGYTTGGGLGPLARTYGLASDRVVAFDVVTGDGELRRATATHEPELFWGLRGGKGLLGIVTAIEVELVEAPDLYAGALYFDGADARAALHAWAQWCPTLPREATTSVALLRLPPLPDVPPPLAGRLSVAVRFAWCGDAERGAAELAAMREVATPLIDTVGPLPHAAIGAVHADPVDPMPSAEKHCLLASLPTDAVDALLALAGPDAESPQIAVEVRQLGGAVAAAADGSSAYDQRGAEFSLLAVGLGVPPVVDAVHEDGARLLEAMSPWAAAGALPNFAPGSGPEWLERTYTRATVNRLARVSRCYDPRSTVLGAADLAAVPATGQTLRSRLGSLVGH
ncbi:FAD-binding oxidoreductase [Nocardioides marinquilinus]|uniref:FAD-binding oxidoreductase n=1 Tax=Nocardioides marinquilinus TaxID=1210400 RepID=A0ABP9PAF1_9ACTN